MPEPFSFCFPLSFGGRRVWFVWHVCLMGIKRGDKWKQGELWEGIQIYCKGYRKPTWYKRLHYCKIKHIFVFHQYCCLSLNIWRYLCSLWDYTNVVMNFLCRQNSHGDSFCNYDWLENFDLVITGRFGFFLAPWKFLLYLILVAINFVLLRTNICSF